MDRQLIDLLRANGRASYAELARQVGLSSPAVHERVGKLESAGVITGYRAVIDPTAVGLDVTALISVIESDAVDDTGVEEGLRALPEVEDCWRVAGSEGYVLKVRVPGHPGTRGHHRRVEPDQGRRAHPHDRCPVAPSGRAVMAESSAAAARRAGRRRRRGSCPGW